MSELGYLPEGYWAAVDEKQKFQEALNKQPLYHADPNCQHDVYAKMSGGVACRKCSGWFCY